MKRLLLALICAAAVMSAAVQAHAAGSKLISDTGNLLKGTVYKQSGIPREGVITIRTKWNLPAIAPVFRYDFDLVFGKVENNLYSFQMGDIAEMEFLPGSDGDQFINVKLRNGVIHKIMLTSEQKAVIGTVSVWITEVSVLTEGYGENIIPFGEVEKITFFPPVEANRKDMAMLVGEFEKALAVGVRDDLIDEELATVLDKIQKNMKARLLYEKKNEE